MLREGDRIGDWIVDRCLGEGGMGAVYACHNVLSERIRAAVKVLKGHGLGQSRERFVREVELLAAVQHPAVVRVMGGGEDVVRGVLWFAMELVEGETLHDRLARGPLAWEDAVRIFGQLGAGLLHAHRMGVVHRDIKPGNIILLPDGGAKLLDFGIAVQQGATRYTKEGLVPGTMAYLPPEVFSGRKPDLSADIYALGQVLWETLTGRQAYPEDPDSSAGENMARLMGAKLQAEPLDPGEAVPSPLREVVLKATAPEPEERLNDLAPFLEALRATGALDVGDLPPARLPPQRAPETFAIEGDKPAKTSSSSRGSQARAQGPGPRTAAAEARETRPATRSRLPLFLAGVALFVGMGCAGCLGLAMLLPDPDQVAVELPTSGGFYGLPAQEVPAGFPFTVPDDATIIMGSRTESDGNIAFNVTYTTDEDPKALIDGYARQFEARGLTLSRSNMEMAGGTTWTVTGYTLKGESAVASAGPQPMGMMVTVSWVPGR